MAKSDHIYHGDPRYHADDISELKVRIAQLEEEVKDLTIALVAATENKSRWRRGW